MRRQLDLPILVPPRPAPASATRTGAEEFPDLLDDEDQAPFLVGDEERPARDRSRLPPRAELLASAKRIADVLSAQLSRPVRLSVTDNRSIMVSFRRRERVLQVRLHHMFLTAPPEVIRAVGEYAGKGSKAANARIDAYVREHLAAIRETARARLPKLESRGRVHDLQAIFDQINADVFQGRIAARIGWGRGPLGRRRRTIRMGVYDHVTRTIRIHRALDRVEVPGFFVAYIVFHEMLHQAVPHSERSGGRREHHGAEFVRLERAWPDYARAIAWEKENLGLLLGKSTGRLARSVD